MKDLQKKMNMGISKSLLLSHLIVFSLSLSPLVVESATNIPEDDVRCLQGVKDSFTDPGGKLLSWSFTNRSAGFICKFVGVSCWNVTENRVLSIELRGMGLSGKVPDSLMYCGSLLNLDLSANDMDGAIPSEICTWLPYSVTLDLSNNSFTGVIPSGLGKCKYLNALVLSNNRLTGSIPPELSNLIRLKQFSVANNLLSGAVPSFIDGFDKESFVGNKGLCGGGKLEKCGGLSNKDLRIIIGAGFGGAALPLLLLLGWWWWRWYYANPRG